MATMDDILEDRGCDEWERARRRGMRAINSLPLSNDMRRMTFHMPLAKNRTRGTELVEIASAAAHARALVLMRRGSDPSGNSSCSDGINWAMIEDDLI